MNVNVSVAVLFAVTAVGVIDALIFCILVIAVPEPTVNEVEPLRVVNAPVLGVVEPIVPGIAQVEPSNWLTFKLLTTVVDAMTSGAVPVDTVEVSCPLALSVVKAPAAGVVEPSEAGIAQSLPSNLSAFRLATRVVELTASGAVPVATVEMSCDAVVMLPLVEMVVRPLSAPANVMVPDTSSVCAKTSHR